MRERNKMCVCSFGPNSGIHEYDVKKSKITYFKYDPENKTFMSKQTEQADSEALPKDSFAKRKPDGHSG